MDNERLKCARCFDPVLLTATYNEDQINFLFNQSINWGVALLVYVIIDAENEINKMQYLRLTPRQIIEIRQNDKKENKLTFLLDNQKIIEVKTNIEGLIVDKNSADLLIEVESNINDQTDLLHINNKPENYMKVKTK